MQPENANLYYNMIYKVMNRFMGWWLFTLRFREARWRFDKRLKGDDERRGGGGGGKRWEMENWQRKCCTNNNQWRSVWGRAADSAFLNMERNEKLKMSNLIILSSAASVMHGGRPACLHFISLQRRKKKRWNQIMWAGHQLNIEKMTAVAARFSDGRRPLWKIAVGSRGRKKVVVFLFSNTSKRESKVKWDIFDWPEQSLEQTLTFKRNIKRTFTLGKVIEENIWIDPAEWPFSSSVFL